MILGFTFALAVRSPLSWRRTLIVSSGWQLSASQQPATPPANRWIARFFFCGVGGGCSGEDLSSVSVPAAEAEVNVKLLLDILNAKEKGVAVDRFLPTPLTCRFFFFFFINLNCIHFFNLLLHTLKSGRIYMSNCKLEHGHDCSVIRQFGFRARIVE